MLYARVLFFCEVNEAVRFRVSTKGNGFLPRSNNIGKEPITLSAYPKSNSLNNNKNAKEYLCLGLL